MSARDGGQAFPIQSEEAIRAYAQDKLLLAEIGEELDGDERDRIYLQAKAEAVGGLTKREYYATRAMQAILSHLPHGIRPGDLQAMARDSFRVADAMIEAGAAD